MASRKQELLGAYLDSLGEYVSPYQPPTPTYQPSTPTYQPAYQPSGQYQGQYPRRRRHRHHGNQQQRIAALQARAASGDQTAIAKLQQIQQRLSSELSTLNTPGTVPGVTPPPPPPPVTTPVVQYAYQSPYYDPSTMNPYDPPPPAPPAPPVDVYQGDMGYNGHLAFIRGLGEEEIALAREGGASERAALRRRFNLGGESCPELEIRAAAGDVMAQQALALKKATGQC